MTIKADSFLEIFDQKKKKKLKITKKNSKRISRELKNKFNLKFV